MLRPRCSTFALSCLCWTGALALIACPSAREGKQERSRGAEAKWIDARVAHVAGEAAAEP